MCCSIIWQQIVDINCMAEGRKEGSNEQQIGTDMDGFPPTTVQTAQLLAIEGAASLASRFLRCKVQQSFSCSMRYFLALGIDSSGFFRFMLVISCRRKLDCLQSYPLLYRVPWNRTELCVFRERQWTKLPNFYDLLVFWLQHVRRLR